MKNSVSPRAHFCARFFCAILLALTTIPARAAPPTGTDFELGGSGDKPGQFADLRDMAFDAKDNLYTLEGPRETKDRDKSYAGNARVQKFDNAGKFLSQFSIRDETLDKKDDPRHIAADAQGHVFVTYPQADIVREFGPDGAKLRDIAIPAANAITSYNGKIAVTGGANKIVNGKNTQVGGEAITIIQGEQTQTVPLTQPVARVADMTADKSGNLYVLAAVNSLYKFAPDGKLLKTLGAETNVRVEDGSELKESVEVDSKGNVYAMAGSFLTRFDADFKTVAQREVRYKWFEPSGWKMLAIDSRDRIWAATPDLVTHQLFERFHFRPVIVRASTSYFDPKEQGVRVASALGIGLKADIDAGPAFNVAYDLKEFPSELVIAPANRNVQKLSVDFRVLDANRQLAANKKFDLPLEDGKEIRAPLNFTPPRFGWYLMEATISADGQELFRIGENVGVTPDFPGMIRIEKVEGMGATNDAPKQMFVGLPNMRLNAGADPKSLENLEKTLATAQKYGATPFVAFTDEKDVTEATVRAAVTQFKGRVKYWEVINEPNLRMKADKYVNDYLSVASRIIHEVDPDAKVMGPATVNLGLEWIEEFYKAGGGKFIDVFSVHDYEGHETIDPIHWRWKFGELRKLMAKYGDGNKEIWQTERVFSAVRGGNFMPIYQAANMAQHRDVLETLGVKPDHNNHYYVNSMGYATVPSYIWDGSGPFPAAFVLRTRYAQTLGRKYAGTLDFGANGNDIFSALRYTGADGQTIILRNEGVADQKLSLGVAGGNALQVVDAWGNVSSVPVQGGKVELTVGPLPQYLKLAAGQSVATSPMDFGRNLAERATFSYSARVEKPFLLLNNGIIEVIHSGNPNGGTDGGKIWTGDMPEIDGKVVPQTLDIQFDAPRTFDKIVLRGLRADNQFSTLLDYDIQAEIDGNWKTIVEARTAVPPSDSVSLSPTLVTTWQANEHYRINRLAAPVTSSHLRLVALRTTYGFQFDKLAAEATQTTWGGHGNPKLMLREIEIYAPQSPIKVAAQVAQPQKTAVFAPEEATVTFANSSQTAFAGTAKMSAPDGWTITPAQVALNIAPGKTQTAKVRVAPATTLPIGAAFVDVNVSNAAGKAVENGWLRYDIASPIELMPGGARDVGTAKQALTASVKNLTDKPLSGVAKLEVAGQNLEQPFGPIDAGKSADVAFAVPDLKLTGALLTANYVATANNLEIRAMQPLGVREWNVIGTWEKDLETAFGPEKTVGKVDVSKNFVDGMGAEQKWKVFASQPDGYLDLLPLPVHENVTAYALIYVDSPKAQRAIFSAGTDDGGKAYLNGAEVFTDTKAHDSAPGQVKVPVQLKAGRNEVLYKIVQGKFKMGLHFDLLDTTTGKPLEGLSFSPR